MTIVSTHYRYKRPPKRKKAVALEGRRIVTIRDKKRAPAEKIPAEAEPKAATNAAPAESTSAVVSTGRKRAGASAAPAPAANEERRSAIVTAEAGQALRRRA